MNAVCLGVLWFRKFSLFKVIKLFSNGSHYLIRFVDLFRYVYAKTQLVIEYDPKVFFLIDYPEWFSTPR